MMTNIAAVVLGVITIICLAAFRVSQKRKIVRFRDELISQYKGAAVENEKEAER
ncbi:MAG: hypothetical protein IJJ01_11500 [Firmicutes bacterium]|nr:hypothetical protein [Bacillota bacterium]